jgi:hypothetical protein
MFKRRGEGMLVARSFPLYELQCLPKDAMRSDLVFSAMTYVSNRFLLTSLVSKATRRFHVPNTRMPDTANDVFSRFNRVNPMAGVACTGNLPPSSRVAQEETHSLYGDSSVAQLDRLAEDIVPLPPDVVYGRQWAPWEQRF